LWNRTFAGESAILPVRRFDVSGFPVRNAALVPGDDPPPDRSRLYELLDSIRADATDIPRDTPFLLATSKGEIDLFEKALRDSGSLPSDFSTARVLSTAARSFGLDDEGLVVSAACASATTALAMAADRIRRGRCESVLVLAADLVTPFVFSGFVSLMALDPKPARPFDRDRRGLSLGEGAAWTLLSTRKNAERRGYPIFGFLHGWGCSNDANHATGPSRDGDGLARAIRLALGRARLDAPAIRAVCAHGTGTRYNDWMEIRALESIFTRIRPPVFSIKGTTGHLLGACGLVETLFAARASGEGRVPPAANLQNLDPAAEGWVPPDGARFPPGAVLSTNSGFGGINAALIVSRASPGNPAGRENAS
jgi:3-oxoacyl-[acyl-carrier-protein] synthase II